MTVIPYLIFQGTCHAAMTFYADAFGTEIDMITKASEMPDFPAPPGKEDQIAHCNIKVAGGEIYASDDIMGGSDPMAGCSVMVSLPSVPDSAAAFKKLATGGSVEMPFGPTFWSRGFGTLTDRFGTKWMISTDEDPAETAGSG